MALGYPAPVATKRSWHPPALACPGTEEEAIMLHRQSDGGVAFASPC